MFDKAPWCVACPYYLDCMCLQMVVDREKIWQTYDMLQVLYQNLYYGHKMV